MSKNFGSRLCCAIAIPALLSSVGCASKNTPMAAANNGKVFAVTAESAKFFRYGPQQGNGPDEELPKDTLVTLIRPSFGYAKVQLVGRGQEGYVASEDIKPAPPTLLAALNAPLPPSTSSSTYSENFDTRSSEPPPPEALPDPDLPPASDVSASDLPPSTGEPLP